MSLAALLVYEQQASLKWWPPSVHLTACGDCKKKIYEPTFFFHTNVFRVEVNLQFFKLLHRKENQYSLRSNFIVFSKIECYVVQ